MGGYVAVATGVLVGVGDWTGTTSFTTTTSTEGVVVGEESGAFRAALAGAVGAGDDAGQDAQPTPDRLALLGGAVWRFPLRRRPAIGRWSPRQLVPLSAVCRDASGRCSRKRVCTIATRNKTSHSSAHGCGAL